MKMVLVNKKYGMSLVEVVIAAAIILLISAALVAGNLAYIKTASINLKTTKAIYLLEEGVEVVNYLKNQSWNNLGSVGTNYFLFWTGSAWVATTSPIVIDQLYTRKFLTETVNRDVNQDIVTVGGTLDINTRKLTVTVDWLSNNGQETKSLISYVMVKND